MPSPGSQCFGICSRAGQGSDRFSHGAVLCEPLAPAVRESAAGGQTRSRQSSPREEICACLWEEGARLSRPCAVSSWPREAGQASFPYSRELANDARAMLIGAISLSHASMGKVVGEFMRQPVNFGLLPIRFGDRRFGSRGNRSSGKRKPRQATAFIFPTLDCRSPGRLGQRGRTCLIRNGRRQPKPLRVAIRSICHEPDSSREREHGKSLSRTCARGMECDRLDVGTRHAQC